MNSPQEHMGGLLAAYALDAVDEAERVEIELHLQDCAECQHELAYYSETVAGLSAGLEEAPPQSLRAQILDSVAEEATIVTPIAPRRRRKTQQWVWGLAAAGVLAVGAWGVTDVLMGNETSVTDQVIQADDSSQFSADYANTTLTVYVSGDAGQAVLSAPGMPALAEGEVYQAWFVTPEGTVVSAGVMPQGAEDFELDGDPSSATAVALTIEQDPGAEQPTTDPVAAVPLEA